QFQTLRSLSQAAAQASHASTVSQSLTTPLKTLRESDAYKAAPAEVRTAVDAFAADLAAMTTALRDPAPAEVEKPSESGAPARPAPAAQGPTVVSRISQLVNALDAITEAPERSYLATATTLTQRAEGLFRAAMRLSGAELTRLNKALTAVKLPALQPAADDFASAGGGGFVAQEAGEAG
ncbi:MAG: hypothetical protein NT029_22175, partial [Armatimonadetes bacterium]|nr:hypothetical protein [Armatimonadota bacterium]